MRYVLFFIGGLLFFSSCVPNKKIVYLQRGDLHKKNLPKDTLVRAYQQVPFDYRIQPNDALYVRFESLTAEEFDFFKDTDPQGNGSSRNFVVSSELVDPDGNIIFPVVGKVKASGLTVFQVQDTLQAVANQYLESPVVKVRLVNFRFTVLGEVMTEGTITTFNNRVSIVEALGLAGGLGDLADRQNVKIIRQNGNQTEIGYVNMLSEDLLQSPFYFVNQNDVLIVPPLKQRPFRKYFGQNLSLFVSSLALILVVVNISNN